MYGMPTASVARMPPSTAPEHDLAEGAVAEDGGDDADDGRRDPRRPRRGEHARSRSPTMKSVANTPTMTPSRMGMPVRGAVVSRHQRSAEEPVACAASASARASACRALEISRASPSSASVRKPPSWRPTARITSSSPSSTERAAARGPRPPGAGGSSSARAAMWSATSATRSSTSAGRGCRRSRRGRRRQRRARIASLRSATPSPRGATVATTGTPRSRESTSASGTRPRRRASSDRLSAMTTR